MIQDWKEGKWYFHMRRPVMCLQRAEGTRCYQQGRAKGRAASVVGHGVLSQLPHARGQASETGYIATHAAHAAFSLSAVASELQGKQHPTSWSLSTNQKGARCLTPETATPDHASARCSRPHLAHMCSQAGPDFLSYQTCLCCQLLPAGLLLSCCRTLLVSWLCSH